VGNDTFEAGPEAVGAFDAGAAKPPCKMLLWVQRKEALFLNPLIKQIEIFKPNHCYYGGH